MQLLLIVMMLSIMIYCLYLLLGGLDAPQKPLITIIMLSTCILILLISLIITICKMIGYYCIKLENKISKVL